MGLNLWEHPRYASRTPRRASLRRYADFRDGRRHVAVPISPFQGYAVRTRRLPVRSRRSPEGTPLSYTVPLTSKSRRHSRSATPYRSRRSSKGRHSATPTAPSKLEGTPLSNDIPLTPKSRRDSRSATPYRSVKVPKGRHSAIPYRSRRSPEGTPFHNDGRSPSKKTT